MFSDIASDWASQCIEALARRKIVTGYPNGTFRPKATVTRAEFAALMPKVFPDLAEQRAAASFRDVPPQHWANEVVEWNAQRGLFSGYEDGTFRPSQTISRVEAVRALMQALEATQGVDVVIPDAQAKPTELDLAAQYFSDADQIPGYGREAIAAALKQKLLEPLSEPRPLRPHQAMTRGEVAALLCRALDIPKAELMVSYPSLSTDSQSIFQQFLQQEAMFDQSKLAFLDRSIQNSPYRSQIAQYASRLQQPEGVVMPLANAALYPKTGEVFFVNEGGLEFLPADIRSACVCLSTVKGGELYGRWLGREALSDRQLWSATKFIPLLNLAARANAVLSGVDINQCRVRSAGSTGRFSGYPFSDLAAGIMTYDNRVATSNSLAAMFKNFAKPESLEKWTREMTGNQSLSFQGRYGEVAFIQYPELWSAQANKTLLKSPGAKHQGENLMSTYDLTRLLSMTGWHWQLPADARIPGLQARSVESILRAMGLDTARYGEVALETLGLTGVVKSPVIVSKSGFGRSDERDRTELTYCALVQFSLPRSITGRDTDQATGQSAPDPTAAYQRHSICFTLIAEQGLGDANEEAQYVDALMAAAVTEIIRRTVLGAL
ncbi:MAG: S-layer homology domain-containing protein [Phormidesmis sp.]